MRAPIVVAALLVVSAPAAADERITDDTPYKTPEGKVRAGLWKLQYGVHHVPGLEIGTHTLPYVMWAVEVKTVNAHAKYQLLRRGRWALAASLGATYVDFRGLDIDASVTIVPVQLLAARRMTDRITLGAGLMYSHIYGAAAYNKDEDTAFRGAVAVSNVQSWLALMFAISRRWTLYVESRGISSTAAAGSSDVTYMIDERTRVEVALTGNASIEELQGASTLVAFQWSRERFRIRFGLGYGNYNVPMINFIVPAATPFPELDLFWVF